MNKVSMRLQTPVDGNGNRTDIHVITSADEVITNPSDANPKMLTEKLDIIDNSISAVTSTANKNKNDISNLSQSLSDTNNEVSANTSSIANVKKVADKATTDIGNLNSALNSTNNNVGSNTQNITKNTNDITKINSTISEQNKTIESINNDKTGKIVISDTQPKYACVWAKPISNL